AEHAGRLAAQPDAALQAVCAAADPERVEAEAGLAPGSLRELAAMIAAAKNPVFVSHRGWFDPGGQVPRLLTELDRLLAGNAAAGIVYVRSDCNSRGVAALAASADPEPEGDPEVLVVFGADPLGTAVPGSAFETWTRRAKFLVVFETQLTPTAEAAHVVLPLRTFAEKDGTFVASNGLAQQLRAALSPPPTVPALRESLAAVAAGFGHTVSFAPPAAARTPVWSPPERPAAVAATPAGGRLLHLRWSPYLDDRVRSVAEADRIFPGPALEVNPGDLAGLGLANAARARLVSGGASVTVAVRADRRTPPGQLYLPLDPLDAALKSFARDARHPAGWPLACVLLDGVEPVAAG
ncbi:MAG TPA: molybdopterin-dependent oxidoreductase, partial [bacterium]